MIKKHAAVLPLIITALLLTGCEEFNAPIKPFIDMNTATVSLSAMNIGAQVEGTHYVRYNGADRLIPVVFNNPQQFNIQAAIKSAVKNGDPASGVSVVSWTKNDALVRISGVEQGDAYQITLRVTSKDGVASGARTFDIPLPRIVFTAPQKIVDPKVALVGGAAHAQVKILQDSLKKIDTQLKYVATDRSSYSPGVTQFDWDDSTNRLLYQDGSPVPGLTVQFVNGYLELDLVLPPLSSLSSFNETTILGYSFEITIEDELGESATDKSPGFDLDYCNYKVEWEGKYYYKYLKDAMADVNATGTGTSAAPDVIIVLDNLTHSGTMTIGDGTVNKYVRLTVPPNEGKTITLDAAHSGNVFAISANSSFVFAGNESGVLAVDGNGVALTNAALVRVEAGGALLLENNAELRDIQSTTGSAIRVEGSFTMSGGTIAEMKANDGAVGLADSSAVFTMSGGTITDNTHPSVGENIGVKVSDGTFKMEGGAVVNANNGVFLASGTTITIGGELTGTAPVAKITLPEASYTANTPVLTGTTHLTDANIAHFAVANSAWYIQSAGTNAGCLSSGKVASRAVSGGTLYYASLVDAVDAASGTSAAPDVITVLEDFMLSERVTVSGSGKHIRLTVPPNASRTITLEPGFTLLPGENAFDISANSTFAFAGNGSGVLAVDGNKASVNLGSSALVSVTNATLRLEHGAVLRNAKTTGQAPIRVTGGLGLIMQDGSITGMEGVEGGAVYVSGATFTMEGGTISGNNATDGGGVYYERAGSFIMSGGTISGNTATGNGGGVFVNNSAYNPPPDFKMSGTALIQGNDAVQGKGVYVSGGASNYGTLSMEGGARVAANNEVYLGNGTAIRIDGNITASGIVATIKPETTTAGTQVLGGDTGLISANYTKFALHSSVTGRTIGSDGLLQ